MQYFKSNFVILSLSATPLHYDQALSFITYILKVNNQI